jgi:CTP synthase
LSKDTEAKVALFCDIEPEAVIQLPDADNLYEIPLILREQGLDDIVVDYFRLECGPAKMEEWEAMVRRAKTPKNKVRIGIVGKYTELPDSYLSVSEALRHAGIFHQAAVEIKLIFSGDIDSAAKAEEILAGFQGILVPGGFGSRGIEGKILAIQYARERGIPYFGISLGLQLALVEYGRHVLGLDAGSEEAHPDRKDLVVHYARKEACGNKSTFGKNGSMRLGSYGCALTGNSRAGAAYGVGAIRERHRHRLEFNNAYRQVFAAGGILFSGLSEDGEFVEVAELPSHPWFVACSYQPEFKSRPNRVHPLFRDFVGAALAEKDKAGSAGYYRADLKL